MITSIHGCPYAHVNKSRVETGSSTFLVHENRFWVVVDLFPPWYLLICDELEAVILNPGWFHICSMRSMYLRSLYLTALPAFASIQSVSGDHGQLLSWSN